LVALYPQIVTRRGQNGALYHNSISGSDIHRRVSWYRRRPGGGFWPGSSCESTATRRDSGPRHSRGVIRVSGSGCRPPTGSGGSGPPQVVLDAPRKVVVQGRHAPSASGLWTLVLHVPADERPGVYKLTASCIAFALNGSVTPFAYRPVLVLVRPRSAAHKGQPAGHHVQATPRAAGASRLPVLSRVLPGPGQLTFTGVRLSVR
jgi:hypothetical protein